MHLNHPKVFPSVKVTQKGKIGAGKGKSFAGTAPHVQLRGGGSTKERILHDLDVALGRLWHLITHSGGMPPQLRGVRVAA